MHLADLLKGLATVSDEQNVAVRGLALDSRRVKSGDVFFACKGEKQDGRLFIDKAISQGASAVIAQAGKKLEVEGLHKGVPILPIRKLPARIGQIAARFHDYPARHLWLISITGTNGKTSTCQFIAQWYQALGKACGISGTLGSGLYGASRESAEGMPGTTPDAVSLQKIYAEVREAGAGVMAMEVSSHGLTQHRVDVDDMAVAVFTNLTRDHLDYHGSMDAYGEAKRQLFTGKNLKVAVVNLDDSFSTSIIQDLPSEVQLCTYSLTNSSATVFARKVEHRAQGMSLDVVTPWGEASFQTSLLGSFNAGNLLAALTSVLASESRNPDFDFKQVVSLASCITPVSGRMEIIGEDRPSVVVDYAHTPDGLKTALGALKEHYSGDIWCVFGCGGNRDAGKRPMMAAVAEEFSTRIVVTDDNPREEASQAIISDILKGFSTTANVEVISDRAEAIGHAIRNAGHEDVVLIAGKGHETYQDVSGNRLAFSDVKQARLSLQQRSAGRGRA